MAKNFFVKNPASSAAPRVIPTRPLHSSVCLTATFADRMNLAAVPLFAAFASSLSSLCVRASALPQSPQSRKTQRSQRSDSIDPTDSIDSQTKKGPRRLCSASGAVRSGSRGDLTESYGFAVKIRSTALSLRVMTLAGWANVYHFDSTVMTYVSPAFRP